MLYSESKSKFSQLLIEESTSSNLNSKMRRDSKTLIKIILDIAILFTVGIPVLVFHLCGQPHERGFFCDDDSIRYPYRDSTVSNNLLYVIGILLPILVIIATEFANETHLQVEKRGQVVMLFGRPVPRLIWKMYIRIGIFLFGACVSQLTTDIAKYSIGRLRPHFIEVCQPSVNCNTITDPHTYIEKYQCYGDEDKIREARLSFPSGHSSFSAYTMVFTVIYLQTNMECKTNKLLKPFFQFGLLMMTWYTALSRISDYKHHWSDVLIGFLLGVIAAVIVAFYVSDFFTKKKENSDDITLHNISTEVPPNYNTMDVHDVENQCH